MWILLANGLPEKARCPPTAGYFARWGRPMKSWQQRVKDSCRSLAITVAATLIVGTILGIVLNIAWRPNTPHGVAIRTDQHAALDPERD
jgi:hypothetical protein